MGVDELVLNEVVRRVLAVAKPDRIILFGSAAPGDEAYLPAVLTVGPMTDEAFSENFARSIPTVHE
jgi:hypothetical protein